MITGVGDCGAKGDTRATALTICRSMRGIPTGDSCMKGQIKANVSCMCSASYPYIALVHLITYNVSVAKHKS